jgi:hypothetical protein
MSDLVEFLLARIADREAAARGDCDFDRPHWAGCTYFAPEHMGGGECDCNYAAHVLADCEAKRRIVETYADMLPVENERRDQVVTLRWTCQLLALPDAEHPDYRPEWRP